MASMSTDLAPASVPAPATPAPAAPVAAPPQAPPAQAPAAEPSAAVQRVTQILQESNANAAAARAEAAALREQLAAQEQRFAPLQRIAKALEPEPVVPEIDPFTEYQNTIDKGVTAQAQRLERVEAAQAAAQRTALRAEGMAEIQRAGLSPAIAAVAAERLTAGLNNIPLYAENGVSLTTVDRAAFIKAVQDNVIASARALEASVRDHDRARAAAPPVIVPPGGQGGAPLDLSKINGKGGLRAMYQQLHAAGIQPQ